MRVAILGVNGRIGHHIWERLHACWDMEIIGCARSGPLEAGWIRFNPLADDWAALGKVDILINAIGTISNSAEEQYRVHMELAEKIISNYPLIGRPRIIQLSALGADASSTIPFLQTKGLADDKLLALGHTLILRPSIVCMPGTMLEQKIGLLKRLSRFTFYTILLPEAIAQSRIQPVMVEDICALIEKLCRAPWKSLPPVIPLTGPEVLRIYDVMAAAFEHTRRLKCIPLPAWLMRNVLAKLFPSLISRQQYDLLQTDNIADNSTFIELVGRQPASTLPFWKACASS